MARTDIEVVDVLLALYDDTFGGKSGQRFVIAWSDLRSIYGFAKLFGSRFEQLAQIATQMADGKRLYLLDLGEGENGHLIAVIKTKTVDRWRRVPKKLIDNYRMSLDDPGTDLEDDDDEE